MKAQSIARRVACAGLALAVTGGAAACSKTSSSPSASGGAAPAAGGGTYTVWDPYPQFDGSSAWSQLLTKCGTDAGVTIKRTGYDTTDLTNKELLAAQQGNSPDVLIVDNPVVSTLADAGVLTDTGQTKLDTSAISSNLLAAGQLGGKTYGIPIGANTLALYYNKAVLDGRRRGHRLGEGLAVADRGAGQGERHRQEGHHVLRDRHGGGQLPVPALVLGLRGEPDQARLAAGRVRAVAVDRLAEEGLRPELGHQQHADDQLAGVRHRAVRLQRERHLAAGQRQEGRLRLRDHPDPGDERRFGGGARPAGSSSPSRSSTRPAATPPRQKLVTCLTSADNALATDTTLSYIGATQAVQTKQAASPDLKPWVDAVAAAKGRTSDNLGTKYPKISEPLWTAVQAALSGSASPSSALTTAQTAAAAATK